MMTIQELQNSKPDYVKIRLEETVKLFSENRLTDTVKIALINTVGKPCDRWSFHNKILMVVQGTMDARGYNQWLSVGRNVIKGRKAIQILKPNFIKKKVTDEQTGEEYEESILIGFGYISVFRYEDTEGKALEQYKPKTIPKLSDVAKKIGVTIEYDYAHGGYGCFMHGDATKKIILESEDPEVFYHELVHSVQQHLFKDLKGGQDPENEAIAELGSCVLASLYGQDIKNNAWSYIAGYAEQRTPEAVGRLCIKVIEKTYKILSFIIENTEDKTNG